LIIQDELHLISGPLGTVAGLYEMAIDLLTSRKRGDHCIRPKIVASTATVRRAQGQICRLFGRSDTAVFPPPGIDRKHSFFAETLAASREPARLYVGVASQGRGPKLLFLRVLQTLLSGAQALSVPPVPNADDPADPYLTVLCYFNALRELGAARRLVEDEIREHVAGYGSGRWRHDPPGRPFADRVLRPPVELTSREPTDDVAMAKERLGVALRDTAGATRDEAIDVALATNMISVGLDISRLGLMMVQGQPKTTAEYIQATSRVGRETSKPGLVATVLNLHKPRDRTHYEQFRAFHASFYRARTDTGVRSSTLRSPGCRRCCRRSWSPATAGCRIGRSIFAPRRSHRRRGRMIILPVSQSASSPHGSRVKECRTQVAAVRGGAGWCRGEIWKQTADAKSIDERMVSGRCHADQVRWRLSEGPSPGHRLSMASAQRSILQRADVDRGGGDER
jgi:hypothetical protein